jgi:hypothetical protein
MVVNTVFVDEEEMGGGLKIRRGSLLMGSTPHPGTTYLSRFLYFSG